MENTSELSPFYFLQLKKRILSESGEKYVKIKHQVKKKV